VGSCFKVRSNSRLICILANTRTFISFPNNLETIKSALLFSSTRDTRNHPPYQYIYSTSEPRTNTLSDDCRGNFALAAFPSHCSDDPAVDLDEVIFIQRPPNAPTPPVLQLMEGRTHRRPPVTKFRRRRRGFTQPPPRNDAPAVRKASSAN
jgi:hypothetical protein